MQSSRVEFLFLKSSIDQFIKDLRKLDEMVRLQSFSEDELLEIMVYLSAAKENIEGIEERYSKLG